MSQNDAPMKASTAEKKKKDTALAIVNKLIEIANTQGYITLAKDWGHSKSLTLSVEDTHVHAGPVDEDMWDELRFLQHLFERLDYLSTREKSK